MDDGYIERAIVWLQGLSKGVDTHELESIALSGLSIDHAEKGLVRCKFTITDLACNDDGNWNNGAIAILIDDICAAAICTVIGHIKVSVDLNISYYTQAKTGEEVEIEAKVIAHSGKLSSAVVNVKKCASDSGGVQIVAMAKQWMISVIRPNLSSML
ncbi:acyl-coenzyme A thioesterase 13-like [Impatiens glandulifera]|uniref:acyl-coenzyme A thioesterase 13-like n=1 Tax=Impatiens glandulifera TaxID=253017 RepID=UPI001FB0A961|nr:acyl-coenzyme A thioesterase 13-like [Impatiens glandulifera]